MIPRNPRKNPSDGTISQSHPILPSAQAIRPWPLVWTDALGIRRERLLPGAFGSPESLTAKARLELELAAAATTITTPTSDVSVAELLLAFLEHAKQHYRRDDGSTPASWTNTNS